MTFAQVSAGVYQWLKENNMETEGVRLVLSFPDAMAKSRADITLDREMQGMMRWTTDTEPWGTKQFMMHGIDVRFESRKDK